MEYLIPLNGMIGIMPQSIAAFFSLKGYSVYRFSSISSAREKMMAGDVCIATGKNKGSMSFHTMALKLNGRRSVVRNCTVYNSNKMDTGYLEEFNNYYGIISFIIIRRKH